ncbi:VWA domain-containing protein [Algicola sagamiensis]|uniref:VWA domain-containing protein n=1 Tax=Algicola sagamiensis TaxID=163869 RepID=UPI0003661B1F|nr:vWA domain-containing protein [Algicola sagamiensis]
MKKTLLALAISACSFSTFAADSYGVLVMDQSGSMATKRLDGQSRCAYSRHQAIGKISKFFIQLNGQQIDIRTFNSGGQLTSLTGGFTGSFVEAMNAVNNLAPEGCTGSTALAEAMCVAADDLRANFTNEANNGARLRVFGSTDGEENDSPVAHCGGGNWQDKVTDKYLTELPPIEFNATIFTSTVSIAGLNNEVAYTDIGRHTAYEVFGTESIPTFEFLKQLAAQTGGTVQVIADNDPDDDDGDW